MADSAHPSHAAELSDAASDTDFAPSAASAVSSGLESSEDELALPASTSRKRKRVTKSDAAAPADLDSGDEITIQKGQARRERKRARKDGGDEEPPVGRGKGKGKGKGGGKAKAKAKAKTRRRKDSEGDDEQSEDIGLSDEDDVGGLIKTRAQRKAEKHTRQQRPRAAIGPSTADVDSIWAHLSSLGVGRPQLTPLDAGGDTTTRPTDDAPPQPDTKTADDDMITITRTYTFAGRVETETKRVPRHSAEGRLWLASQPAGGSSSDAQGGAATAPDVPVGINPDTNGKPEEATREQDEPPPPPPQRPLRRPSRFDGNPSGEIKALPAQLQTHWRTPLTALAANAHRRPLAAGTSPAGADVVAAGSGAARTAKAKRPGALNTVEKSRLDWAGYVDQAGIKDELDEYGRAREGYLGRMDFLGRVQGRRDDAAKSGAAG